MMVADAIVMLMVSSKPLVLIEQPCTHPVQIHGMCGVCGADLTK